MTAYFDLYIIAHLTSPIEIRVLTNDYVRTCKNDDSPSEHLKGGGIGQSQANVLGIQNHFISKGKCYFH